MQYLSSPSTFSPLQPPHCYCSNARAPPPSLAHFASLRSGSPGKMPARPPPFCLRVRVEATVPVAAIILSGVFLTMLSGVFLSFPIAQCKNSNPKQCKGRLCALKQAGVTGVVGVNGGGRGEGIKPSSLIRCARFCAGGSGYGCGHVGLWLSGYHRARCESVMVPLLEFAIVSSVPARIYFLAWMT